MRSLRPVAEQNESAGRGGSQVRCHPSQDQHRRSRSHGVGVKSTGAPIARCLDLLA
jgi:hypothetical protein